MQLWTNLDYSRPELATLVATAGALIDTTDGDTVDAYALCPELTSLGVTP